MRKLKTLTEQGLVVHANNTYSINDKLKSDIKLHGPDFGGCALSQIMGIHFPQLFPLEKNFDDLIKIFGIYVVYCFIEAARPASGTEQNPLSTFARDKLASLWVREVFTPATMYIYFLAAVTNQLDDAAAEIYGDKYSEISEGFKGEDYVDRMNIKADKDGRFVVGDSGEKFYFPHPTSYFADKRFNQIVEDKSSYEEYNKGKPKYELDKAIIKKLTQILQKKYPLHYRCLLEARRDFLGKPKETSINKIRKGIRYFDANEEE
jgi:Mor family transcriptional regulator